MQEPAKAVGDITLVLIDTSAHLLTHNAIHHSILRFSMREVLIFTDRPESWPNYRTVSITPLRTFDEAQNVLLGSLALHLRTQACLVAAFDAFVSDGSQFDPQWLAFDFIGTHTQDGGATRPGLSLRSKRYIEALATRLGERHPGETEHVFAERMRLAHPDDWRTIKIADAAATRRFVASHGAGLSSVFGFQGIGYLPLMYQDDPAFLIDNLPADVIAHESAALWASIEHIPDAARETFSALLEARGHSRPSTATPARAPDENIELYRHMIHMGHERSADWNAFDPGATPEPEQRVIAYYLPQFHPIAENDENWGKGFTEWRNVSRALPLFRGHYQPRHPADLGHYDLRTPGVMEEQAALARHYGIGGWAFYYYWFNRKKVLQMPVERLRATPGIDMPFCLFWANENWTRSWDGMQSSVLLEQKHSPEDDLAFIEEVASYFDDRRYIRFEGRPVLMMYRPQLLPDPRATTERWREWCVRRGHGNPYLIATQAYGLQSPVAFGFDAAAEFPPHQGTAFKLEEFVAYDVSRARFGAERPVVCIDYGSAVRAWSQSTASSPDKIFKCVFPMWDNSARRVSSTPTIFTGSTPALYRQWLEYCLRDAAPGDFVFINAWNEWAEGAYLEPDLHYGHAYLEATRSAIISAQLG